MKQSDKRLLQTVCGVLAAIPIYAGVNGLVKGAGLFFDIPAAIAPQTYASLDSQIRYLSVMWLGYAALIAYLIPNIEKKTVLIRILLSFIFAGGLSRLFSLFTIGEPAPFFYIAIGAELVAPAVLFPWQTLIARRYNSKQTPP